MSTNTHLGQPASQLVLLESIGVASSGDPRQDLDFFRIMPDGTMTGTGATGFRVPRGKALIITDVDWQYGSGSAGEVQTFRILISSLANPELTRRVYESTIVLNNNGQGGISQAMTTGFVVSPRVRVLADVVPGGGKIQHILLRGYLVPTQ